MVIRCPLSVNYTFQIHTFPATAYTFYLNFILSSRYFSCSFFCHITTPNVKAFLYGHQLDQQSPTAYSRPTQPLMWCGQLWQNLVSMQAIQHTE
jgi:hypothetical protein